jgi:DNA-binding NarL/FixJ family response regulator
VSGPLRVLLADDHPIFREGLRLLLDTEDGVEVVGEAATSTEAVAEAGALRPDVVLLDVDMPEHGGLAALPQVLAAAPDTAVVMLTMMDDDATLAAALRAGARGYLLKGVGRTEVVAALRSVAAGGSAYGAGVAERVVERFLAGDAVRPPVFPELTLREREVVALVGSGAANPEIARRLVLSPKTVRNLVSSAMAKLGTPDRTALAVLAREAGLEPPGR